MKTEKDFNTSEDYGKWLKINPQALEARKEEIAEENKGVEPILSSVKCETCGSVKEHPKTGYCFICGTDNWKLERF